MSTNRNGVRRTIEQNPSATPQQVVEAFAEFLDKCPEAAPNDNELLEFVRVIDEPGIMPGW